VERLWSWIGAVDHNGFDGFFQQETIEKKEGGLNGQSIFVDDNRNNLFITCMDEYELYQSR
jgi:hypothetical protein